MGKNIVDNLLTLETVQKRGWRVLSTASWKVICSCMRIPQPVQTAEQWCRGRAGDSQISAMWQHLVLTGTCLVSS